MFLLFQQIESQYTASEEEYETSEGDEEEDAEEVVGEEMAAAEDEDEDADEDSDSEALELYCPACKKAFKTVKA
jgi:hypothetical protein